MKKGWKAIGIGATAACALGVSIYAGVTTSAEKESEINKLKTELNVARSNTQVDSYSTTVSDLKQKANDYLLYKTPIRYKGNTYIGDLNAIDKMELQLDGKHQEGKYVIKGTLQILKDKYPDTGGSYLTTQYNAALTKYMDAKIKRQTAQAKKLSKETEHVEEALGVTSVDVVNKSDMESFIQTYRDKARVKTNSSPITLNVQFKNGLVTDVSNEAVLLRIISVVDYSNMPVNLVDSKVRKDKVILTVADEKNKKTKYTYNSSSQELTKH